MAHCGLNFLDPSDPPASASPVVEITGTHHHIKLIFKFYVEMGSRHVAQASLKFLGLCDPLASASQSAAITGMSHHARPPLSTFYIYIYLLPRQCSPDLYPTSMAAHFHILYIVSLISPTLPCWNPRNAFFEPFTLFYLSLLVQGSCPASLPSVLSSILCSNNSQICTYSQENFPKL
uniref:Uncharacterized protein n=1 Tax=Macaca mulatta TaxID=9544 RepID=A0A5F7ZAA7_MACMU